jgi:hypothetical protein
MNSNSTWRWFLVAAVLFGGICWLKYDFQAAPPATTNGWPAFSATAATSVEVIPAGALEIRADRTNDNWYLSKPYAYPAQSAAIGALLDSLAKLIPAARISAGELRQQPAAGQDYGFDNPQMSLVITTPHHEWQLVVGRRTAPGDQVFLRVVGVDGAFVTDATWLKYLPRTATDWRDTSLVNPETVYDSIVLTNGAKEIELHLDATNHLWRMTRPLQARADSDRINRALQQLRSARVENFVTDDPHVDLSAYGLQPASLDLWLGHDGVLTEGLHTGATLTNNPSLVYAKREGWDGVITTLKEPLLAWHGAVNEFRDPHLIDLTMPINEIDVSVPAITNQYTLQRAGAAWHIAGATYPVDTESVQNFIKTLAGMTALEYEDVVTAPDLQNYGLTHPYLQITLRPTAGDTNQTLAQLSFSSPGTNGLYVRRSDEDFIYRVDPLDLERVPEAGWEFRNRRIWSFPEENIAQITVRQDGRTREILHNGRNDWSLAPGSPGQVYGPTIEEAAHELGEMAATAWVGHRITAPGIFGVTDRSLRIEVVLKSGQKFDLAVGGMIQDEQLALVTIDGDQWGFTLPTNLDQLILSYLTIPANVP